MTEKQENILSAALELFAEEGYNAVSTSKVAKAAKVSEGLIFRHFKNKKGLLDALMQLANDKEVQIFSGIIFEKDPKSLLRKAIDMLFEVAATDKKFWRLQFKLKWELNTYNDSAWLPLQLAMANAFEQLGIDNPKAEAEFMKLFLDGLAGALLRSTKVDEIGIKKLLYTKYEL